MNIKVWEGDRPFEEIRITGAKKTTFADGHPCLIVKVLYDEFGWEEEFRAAVNHCEVPAEGCIFGRDYSEGARIHKALVNAGILVPTGRTVQSGYVTLPECRINLKEE